MNKRSSLDRLRELTMELDSKEVQASIYAQALEDFILKCYEDGCPMVVKAINSGDVILRVPIRA